MTLGTRRVEKRSANLSVHCHLIKPLLGTICGHWTRIVERQAPNVWATGGGSSLLHVGVDDATCKGLFPSYSLGSLACLSQGRH